MLGNDTIIGDPLFAVPLFVTNGSQLLPERRLPHLCYEIHGRDRWYLNLISDTCVSVNAHYTAANRTIDVNVISKVGIKAVNSSGHCVNIEVGIQNGCVPIITETGRPAVPMNRYSSGRISVSKHRERVRVSVPNCENVQLVMWITCEDLQRIHFVVTRGVNLRPTSHGLLGNIHVAQHFTTSHHEVEPFIKDILVLVGWLGNISASYKLLLPSEKFIISYCFTVSCCCCCCCCFKILV